MSRKTTITISFRENECKMDEIRNVRASLVDLPLRKPNCKSSGSLSDSYSFSNLTDRRDSRIFSKHEVSAMGLLLRALLGSLLGLQMGMIKVSVRVGGIRGDIIKLLNISVKSFFGLYWQWFKHAVSDAVQPWGRISF